MSPLNFERSLHIFNIHVMVVMLELTFLSAIKSTPLAYFINCDLEIVILLI